MRLAAPWPGKVDHKEKRRIGQGVLGADKFHERRVLRIAVQSVDAEAAHNVWGQWRAKVSGKAVAPSKDR